MPDSSNIEPPPSSSSAAPPPTRTQSRTLSQKQEDRRCCCDKCHVRTGTVIIAILEILLLFHGLIFLAVSMANGSRYFLYTPDFARVIKCEYLIPLTVLQSMWIVGNICAVFAVKLISPKLMIVQLILRTPPLSTHVVMSCLFVANASKLRWSGEESINWPLVLALSIFVTATLTSMYFTYVVWSCLQYLKYSKAQIRAQKFWIETTVTSGSIDENRFDNRSIAPLHPGNNKVGPDPDTRQSQVPHD